MNVGIVTRYQPCDVTYAALQVADLARRCGDYVSVYTITQRRPPVHARWDDKVVRTVFTTWAGPLDMVVWTECPPPEQAAWVRRPRQGLPDRRTVLIASWDDTGRQVREVYPTFTAVVAPSRSSAEFLRMDMRLENVVEIPWSPSLPITLRLPRPPGWRWRVHFPLCDVHDREHDAMAVGMIEWLLRRQVAVDIRVTLNGRSGEVVRRLERRARQHPGLTMARGGGFEDFVVCLAEQDMTVLLSSSESFGMTALCSLHVGTPIIAFDIPPLDEFVTNEVNGILVPCPATGRVSGTISEDDRALEDFEETLVSALGDESRLAALRATCTAGLEGRTRAFEEAWVMILSEA